MSDRISVQFRANAITPALYEQTLSLRAAGTGQNWVSFYLETGRAHAVIDDREQEILGPSVLWTSTERVARIRVSAGGGGHYTHFGDRMLGDALGMVVEASELRLFVQQPILVTFGRGDGGAQQCDDLFAHFLEETTREEFGQEIAVSAYLRLLIVLLWRNVSRDELDRSMFGPQKALLTRFRGLVEAHFRARWKVKRYAGELGVTYDRLHDLCQRMLGKSPALLIRERCAREALILLSRTSMSSEEIAAALGFGSASQFNHFFKAQIGQSPGRYRRDLVEKLDPSTPVEPPRFSDWP